MADKPSLTLAEQETVIRWDRDEGVAWLYTTDAGQARRWEKLGYALKPDGRAWRGKIDPKLVSFRRTRRVLSPEKRYLQTEILRKAREARVKGAEAGV